MQLRTHVTQKILKEVPIKACLVASGILCLGGGILVTRRFVQASSSEYSSTGSSVTLDGEHNGSATVLLKTSVARSYVAIQGAWSKNEVVDSGVTQTSYLSLSGMKRGGSATMAYGATAYALGHQKTVTACL